MYERMHIFETMDLSIWHSPQR